MQVFLANNLVNPRRVATFFPAIFSGGQKLLDER